MNLASSTVFSSYNTSSFVNLITAISRDGLIFRTFALPRTYGSCLEADGSKPSISIINPCALMQMKSAINLNR